MMPGDPLPSWVEGDVKRSIIDFVRTVTDEANSRHVPAPEPVAVFDNDGTLTGSHPSRSSTATGRCGTSCATARPSWSACDRAVAIQKFIGRRPILAAGNSDGDQQMLEWTAAGPGTSLMLLVDHADAEQEFNYRVSPLGRLERALEEASDRGWSVVSMKDHWTRVFAHD